MAIFDEMRESGGGGSPAPAPAPAPAPEPIPQDAADVVGGIADAFSSDSKKKKKQGKAPGPSPAPGPAPTAEPPTQQAAPQQPPEAQAETFALPGTRAAASRGTVGAILSRMGLFGQPSRELEMPGMRGRGIQRGVAPSGTMSQLGSGSFTDLISERQPSAMERLLSQPFGG